MSDTRAPRRRDERETPSFEIPWEFEDLPRAQKSVLVEHFRVEDSLARSHQRLMDRGDLLAKYLGYLCALASVFVLAGLARDYVRSGAAIQGAVIMVSGAVSLVGIFVTGRLIRAKVPRNPQQ